MALTFLLNNNLMLFIAGKELSNYSTITCEVIKSIHDLNPYVIKIMFDKKNSYHMI